MKYPDEIRKINFRFKYKDRYPSPIKVSASLRVPGARHPKQIHLAYMPERGYVSEKYKVKIKKKFASEWRKFFLGRFPGVDWEDADKKLGSLLRPRCLALATAAAQPCQVKITH